MRKLFSLACLLVFTSASFSQISLTSEHCVENVNDNGNGYCVWSCLATLGRFHKIEILSNLVQDRLKESDYWDWDSKNKVWVPAPYVKVNYGGFSVKEHRGPASRQAIVDKLAKLKVRYRMQEHGNKNVDILRNIYLKKTGCIVVVKNLTPIGSHAILIVKYDDKGIIFFDPNDVKKLYTASWDWFQQNWTGFVIVLEIGD